MTMPKFLVDAPRYMFFTGKGGVGKTSIACAAALVLARGGKRVLLVSTDPASNLGQVFGVQIGNRITAIQSVAGLSALEIDPNRLRMPTVSASSDRCGDCSRRPKSPR